MAEREFKRRLILEVEVPDMYVEDVPELIAKHGFPGDSESESILNCVGEPGFGLLTIEVAGEKDSDIETVKVLIQGARIEDEAPSDLSHLERNFERLEEGRDGRALDDAQSRGYDEGLADGKKEAVAEARPPAPSEGEEER